MTRYRHDCAHRIAVKVLRIFAPLLREEEQQDAYRELMPVLMDGLADFETRRDREAKRLAGPNA
jgi:hypothetical protein